MLTSDQNISDLLTYFFTSEQTGYNPSKDLEIINDSKSNPGNLSFSPIA